MDGIDARHEAEDYRAQKEARKARRAARREFFWNQVTGGRGGWPFSRTPSDGEDDATMAARHGMRRRETDPAKEREALMARFDRETLTVGSNTVDPETVKLAINSASNRMSAIGSPDVGYLKAVVSCPRNDLDIKQAVSKIADDLDWLYDVEGSELASVARAAAIRDAGFLCEEARGGYGSTGNPAEAALDKMREMSVKDTLSKYADAGLALSTMAATYTSEGIGCGFDVARIAAEHGEVDMDVFKEALYHAHDDPSASAYVDTAAANGRDLAMMAQAVENEMSGGNLSMTADAEQDWYEGLEDTLGIIRARSGDVASARFEAAVASAEEAASKGGTMIAFTDTEVEKYHLEDLVDAVGGPMRDRIVGAMSALPFMSGEELDDIAASHSGKEDGPDFG